LASEALARLMGDEEAEPEPCHSLRVRRVTYVLRRLQAA